MLSHTCYTYRVSLQCGFSRVQQDLSSGQTSFHIHYIHAIFLLLWVCPHAFLLGSYTERIFHPQKFVLYPHYMLAICVHPYKYLPFGTDILFIPLASIPEHPGPGGQRPGGAGRGGLWGRLGPCCSRAAEASLSVVPELPQLSVCH